MKYLPNFYLKATKWGKERENKWLKSLGLNLLKRNTHQTSISQLQNGEERERERENEWLKSLGLTLIKWNIHKQLQNGKERETEIKSTVLKKKRKTEKRITRETYWHSKSGEVILSVNSVPRPGYCSMQHASERLPLIQTQRIPHKHYPFPFIPCQKLYSIESASHLSNLLVKKLIIILIK